MNKNTQLLCTFTMLDNLENAIKQITSCYTISFNKIYILESVENPNSLYCTYNIDTTVAIIPPIPPTTISLHRKKITNSLYTLNGLNAYIASMNNGKADKDFVVEWEGLKNCLLLTTYNQLRIIPTKLKEILDLSKIIGE